MHYILKEGEFFKEGELARLTRSALLHMNSPLKVDINRALKVGINNVN